MSDVINNEETLESQRESAVTETIYQQSLHHPVNNNNPGQWTRLHKDNRDREASLELLKVLDIDGLAGNIKDPVILFKSHKMGSISGVSEPGDQRS